MSMELYHKNVNRGGIEYGYEKTTCMPERLFTVNYPVIVNI